VFLLEKQKINEANCARFHVGTRKSEQILFDSIRKNNSLVFLQARYASGEAMKHREIQPAHEESVLESFGQYLQKSGIVFRVTERPDPPDAIVEIGNEICWVEITDAFQSADWARSITSYAADDKIHQPYQRGLIVNPDQEACDKVREVILKKVKKDSMRQIVSQLGQGILLVGCYTPLTSTQEIIEISRSSIIEALSGEAKVFKSIYLYTNGHEFAQLL